MRSIRALKDGAVPVGLTASRTHPIAHLALRRFKENAAINKIYCGIRVEDPVITMLTTAVHFSLQMSSCLIRVFFRICVFVRLVFHACEIMFLFYNSLEFQV